MKTKMKTKTNTMFIYVILNVGAELPEHRILNFHGHNLHHSPRCQSESGLDVEKMFLCFLLAKLSWTIVENCHRFLISSTEAGLGQLGIHFTFCQLRYQLQLLTVDVILKPVFFYTWVYSMKSI